MRRIQAMCVGVWPMALVLVVLVLVVLVLVVWVVLVVLVPVVLVLVVRVVLALVALALVVTTPSSTLAHLPVCARQQPSPAEIVSCPRVGAPRVACDGHARCTMRTWLRVWGRACARLPRPLARVTLRG